VRKEVRAPELVNRNFTESNPDQLWVADFTYCSTWSGIVYISFITDARSQYTSISYTK
jgi:putative transposase